MTDNDDTFDGLLCSALDGLADDPVRAALMVAIRLYEIDQDRDAELGRLRREGITTISNCFDFPSN